MTGDSARAASTESIRLRLQHLSGRDQVLAIGALAALRSSEGVFTSNEIVDLLRDLRLPPIANVSATLGNLRAQALIMQPRYGRWALTPAGESRLNTAIAHVPTQALAAQLGHVPGSDLGETRLNLIPPLLGPMAAAPGLTRLLEGSSFDQNVMLITRYPTDSEDHFSGLIEALRAAVRGHDLNLVLASDGVLEDTLWANVVTYMWASKYAIVLMDTAANKLNYNVLVEIGGMLMTGRRCAILRDRSVPDMPSDLVGHIYKSTDLSDHEESVNEVHKWIRDDLGLGACASCPPAVAITA